MFKTKVSKFVTARTIAGLFVAAIAIMSIVIGPIASAQNQLVCPAGGSVAFINSATGDAVFITDQFPAPNDNSYGVNAVGWGKSGHKFNDLVGSDKSGFQVKNGSTVVLNFDVDYISVKSGTPSGYASLGPFGGDGKINTGTLTVNDVTWDTSLARNLNQLGYFSGGAQNATEVAPGGTNLLINSPATVDKVSNYTLATPNPWTGSYTNPETLLPDYPGGSSPSVVNGWDFHDTYYATINSAKMQALGAIEQVGGQWRLKSGWSIGSNGFFHNSPAKTCPTGTPTPTPTMTPTPTTTPTPPMTATPTPPTTVPEPTTIVLLGSGLLGIGGAAARRFFGKKGKDSESEEDSE